MKFIRHGVRRWVYVLPLLHFCACLTSYVGLLIPSLQHWGILFTFILLFDLPISVVAYALGWKYPTIAVAWIFVVGTLWWYLLSLAGEFVFDRFIDRGPAAQPLIPKSDANVSTRRHG
jgi:hypothetical protein